MKKSLGLCFCGTANPKIKKVLALIKEKKERKER
jgi:hypothetical protein